MALPAAARSPSIQWSINEVIYKQDFSPKVPRSGRAHAFVRFSLGNQLATSACSAPRRQLRTPTPTPVYGRADLSDIDMGNGKSIQVFYRCPSLGTIISGDSSCDHEINRRISLGSASMARIKKKVWIQICTVDRK
jgi:hypothetical protein